METSGEFPPLSLVKKCLHLHVRRRNLRETILKCIITWPTLRKLKRSGRKPGKNIRFHRKSARYDASGIGLVKKENVSGPGSVDFTRRQKIKRKNLFFKTIGILKWLHLVQRSLSESHCCTRVHVSSPPSLRESKVLILFHAQLSAKVSRQEYFKQHFTRHELIRRLNFKSFHLWARFQGNL